ncbi:methyltransferase domain-containing protein [Methanobrevibacter millerae]|uniref:Methyltransferase domain-containing protein n=1 Tax=Methanobrevibacter millerae TaxID=230361 RepID=A0A1G5WWW1_9EURY|nr:methyltransferase domain-containing protein [Methanobrevibacter millerae]SDA61815.1 Methyltransferase domain-containing protein [Methanobrevibacter millerae]
MHQSSFLAMEKFISQYLDKNSILNILDIGSFDSNQKPFNYGLLFNEENWNYFGMDIREGPNVDVVVSDIYNWIEITDESYDVVVSGQAFEHMEFFWKSIVEIERILKPGGFCCIIAPSTGPVHRNPYDCYRFTAEGMNAMGKYAGMEVLEYYTQVSPIWNDSVLICKKLGSKNNLDLRLDYLEKKIDILLKEVKR